ncbi:C40 family peptidase [Nitriliruptor alkaliphilus]|uniref:C40 family peptidase n=1 Tax=Nitriliruptor alkaliphilus TaxID=427918 RepID=UPI000697FA57|nr:C40 family peptidase [Nitriliruptor alkaliphilus]
MPTVAAVTSPVPTTPSPDVAVAPPVPARGFEQALRAVDLRALPSVGLATMVAHRAGEVAPHAVASPAPAAVGEVGEPSAVASGAGSGRGAAAMQAGERYLGVPYLWGGTDPAKGLDCSGFVQRAFRDIGVQLPRVSVDQGRRGQAVASLAEARPGDLVFWRGDGRRPNHIGIYAGDGRMLVAPRTGDVVRYQAITRTPDSIRRVV